MKKNCVNPCEHCEKRSASIFCDLHVDDLKFIDRHKTGRHYKTGEYLFHEGDQPEGLFCIQEGTVKLEVESDSGQQHLLHILEPGDMIGYKAILDGGHFHCAALAMQDTSICFIPKNAFQELVDRQPKVAVQVLKRLAAEVHELESRLCHATDLTATERVAEALLMLKDRWAERNWKRKELADWAGTTEETVIRTLSLLKDEGILEMEGRKIKIVDRKRLLEKARIIV